MNKKQLFEEDPEIVKLRRISKIQQFGKYVTIDCDEDPDIVGERIGRSIAELLREMNGTGIKLVTDSQEIIVKRSTRKIHEYMNGEKGKATVAVKVLGEIKE